MPVLPRFDIQGQVALVTGAARGLGRAIALALAAAGADVALGLRDAGADGGVAAEIEALGRRALPLQMDMARAGQIGPAVEAAPGTSAAWTSWSTTPASPPATRPRTSPRKTSTRPWPSTSRGRSWPARPPGAS